MMLETDLGLVQLRVFEILRRIELSITLDSLVTQFSSPPSSMSSTQFQPNLLNSENLSAGVWITDQLFLPRYMWFKMKFTLPQITNKIQFFNDIRNLLVDLRILFDKGEARIKHLQNLTKILSEIK